MRTWLSDLWHFTLDRRDHPIYQREMAGWAYVKTWRRIRRGCLPLVLLLLFGSMVFCGAPCALTLIPTAIDQQEWWLLFFMLGIGLIISEWVLRFVTSLVVTALSATAISAELEADTYALLRLTPIPPREIVLAKFGAVIAQVRPSFVVMVIIRAVLVVVGVVIVIVAVVSAGSAITLPMPSISLSLALTVLLYLIAGVAFLAAALVALAYYLIRPLLEGLMFAALGIFASALSRTRSNGLLAAGALRFGYGIGSYAAGQVLSMLLSFAAFPLMLLPAMPVWLQQWIAHPAVLLMATAVGSVIVVVVLAAVQLAFTSIFLGLAIDRARHLPFGSL